MRLYICYKRIAITFSEAANVKVTALCGGIGGAKLALGLYQVLDKDELTVICNTGDDIELFGLHISPDVDIVMYTLTGLVDSEKGWGLASDTFSFLSTLSGMYKQDKWFGLGDRDLATHVLRTDLLRRGRRLSEVTSELCRLIGLCDVKLLPMSDDSVMTHVRISDGSIVHFEEFFIKFGCEEDIGEVIYRGAKEAAPAPSVLKSIDEADLIVICPSNPIASIGPILSIKGISESLASARCPRIAVSPLVGGEAIKGPTVKFMNALGLESSALGVARFYREYLSHYTLDNEDENLEPEIRKLGLETMVTNTIMRTIDDKKELAKSIISVVR
jgi:LPPG:FO 2-phospho-L-lactate transferase